MKENGAVVSLEESSESWWKKAADDVYTTLGFLLHAHSSSLINIHSNYTVQEMLCGELVYLNLTTLITHTLSDALSASLQRRGRYS